MTTYSRAPEAWREMGLTDAEYERIVSLMGREPTDVELGMFAVMWSEHCGYKYSRPVLRLFRKYRESLEGAGFENAVSYHWTSDWASPSRSKATTTRRRWNPIRARRRASGGLFATSSRWAHAR
jgi:phosphoribosylformylglycinamidine (FGAM) synthase-like enzyme